MLSLQEDGEICLNSMQCKSRCCQHDTILGIARCTHKAMENSECSPKVCALEGREWGGIWICNVEGVRREVSGAHPMTPLDFHSDP